MIKIMDQAIKSMFLENTKKNKQININQYIKPKNYDLFVLQD